MIDPGMSATIIFFDLFKRGGACIPSSALEMPHLTLSQSPIPFEAQVNLHSDGTVTTPV